MTQSEFYEKLSAYMATPDTFKLIPPLLVQARADHLKIAVISRPVKGKEDEADAVVQVLINRPFVVCATSLDDAQYVDTDLKLGEAALDGYFEALVDCGMYGIAFRNGNTVFGVEWKDLLPGFRMSWDSSMLGTIVRGTTKVGPNDPCPCGSGKKYKKCCGR